MIKLMLQSLPGRGSLVGGVDPAVEIQLLLHTGHTLTDRESCIAESAQARQLEIGD